MQNISFYPGPSKIYPQIAEFMQDAAKSGILSVNHRSKEFVEVSRKAIELLKLKLQIPEDYTVLYVGSATECWEIICQSLVVHKSFHVFNGAFGERGYHMAKNLASNPTYTTPYPYSLENLPDITKMSISEDNEVIFICQNETSNGTTVDQGFIKDLKNQYPHQLLAVDVTSSLAGIYLDFSVADIWYASVQKCLGLPAGMALMILSPQAVAKAQALNQNQHYNSLLALLEKIADYQTTFTPNVLNIYLLMRVMETVEDIQVIHRQTLERAEYYYQFLGNLKNFSALIENHAVRSSTVIAIKAAEADLISTIKTKALKEGILLGNGYGEWRENTFRIANFPALEPEEIQKLLRFLQKADLEANA